MCRKGFFSVVSLIIFLSLLLPPGSTAVGEIRSSSTGQQGRINTNDIGTPGLPLSLRGSPAAGAGDNVENPHSISRWTQVYNISTRTSPALSGAVGGIVITDDGRAMMTIRGTDQINILSADRSTVTTLNVPHENGGLDRFIAYHNHKLFFVNGQYVYAYDEISQTFRRIAERRNVYHGIAVNEMWIALLAVDPCGWGYALDIYNYSDNIDDIAFQKAFTRYACFLYPPEQTVIIDQSIGASGDTGLGWWSKANLVGDEVFAIRGRYDNYWSSNGGLYHINVQSGDVVTRTQSNVPGLLSESPIDSLYDPYSATIYFVKGEPPTIYSIDSSSWTASEFAYEDSYLWTVTPNEILTSLRIRSGYQRITRERLRIFDKSTGSVVEYSRTSVPPLISDVINDVAYRSDTDEIYVATDYGLSVLSSGSNIYLPNILRFP
jgi:hypothetical protein